MRKLLMAAVALICMTMTGGVLSSCSSEEKTTSVNETVFYKFDISQLECYKGEEATLNAFKNDMIDALNVSFIDYSENDIIARLQRVVDTYNNKSLRGTVGLQKSTDNVNFKTIKTFTLKADPKYGE